MEIAMSASQSREWAPRPPRRITASDGVFVVVNIALPLLLAPISLLADGDWRTGICATLLLIGSGCVFANVQQRQPSLFITSAWLFSTIFILFPALGNLGGYWIGGVQSLAVGPTLALTFIWLAALSTGAQLDRLRRNGPAIAAPSFATTSSSMRISAPLTIVAVDLALASYLGLHADRILADRYTSSVAAIVNNTSAMDQLIGQYLPRAVAFAALYVSACAVAGRKTLINGVIFAVSLALYLAYNNPVTTPRQILVAQVTFLAVSLGWHQRLKWRFWGALVAGILFVGPIASFISREQHYARALSFFGGQEFDTLQNSQMFWSMTSSRGILWQPNILLDLSFFLPRELKPHFVDLATAVSAYGGYMQRNISLPIFNQFYADFGLVSLLAYSAILGCIASAGERWAMDQRGRSRLSIGLIYLVCAALALFRGPLLGNLPYIAAGAGALMIIRLAVERAPASMALRGQDRREAAASNKPSAKLSRVSVRRTS